MSVFCSVSYGTAVVGRVGGLGPKLCFLGSGDHAQGFLCGEARAG